MGRNRLTFQRLPVALNNVHVLGSLEFDKRKTLGSKAYFDLRSIENYQLLARDCIASLNEHASPDTIASDLSIQTYARVIRELLKYCANTKRPLDFKMLDIDESFLLSFRAELQVTKCDFKSGSRRRLYGNLLRLLEAGQNINLVNPELQLPRNFKDDQDSDTTQPYTAGEAIDIENACRIHIRELRARIEKGKELLAIGINPKGIKSKKDPSTGRILAQHPSERAWNQLSNLLWYVVNCMDGKYLKRTELLANGHSSFNNSMMGSTEGIYRKHDVYSLLYPLAEDLIPFIILLAKLTGRNESSILDLRRDCLKEFEGRFYLIHVKPRSNYALKQKHIRNDGVFSPVNLIKTILELTEPLIRHTAQNNRDKLFIGLTIKTAVGQDPIKPLDPSYVKFQMNRVDGWCDLHKLTDEHGNRQQISLRRLRTYYLSKKYMEHGQLGKVSRDAAHTYSQTTISYIKNDSTKHIHEQAIEDGIKSARALALPTIVSNESPEIAASIIGVDELLAKKILKGEQDVFFASCKDFYNRPDGQPNMPCDKPWGCFQCSNAIITRHVLPRVLAFKHFMFQQKSELTIEDWYAKFDHVWKIVVNDIIPKFSPEVITEAELQVKNESLYIPIWQKV